MRIIRVTESGRVTCNLSFVPPPPPTEVDIDPLGGEEEEADSDEVEFEVEVVVPACTRSFRVLMTAPTRRTTAD
jgi:hypothetical protein